MASAAAGTPRVTRRRPDAPTVPARAADRGGEVLNKLTKYIPSEVVGGYLAVLALSVDQPTWLQIVVFSAFWGLAPCTVLAVKARRTGDSRRIALPPAAWPWHGMAISSIAFPLWAAAIPGGTLQSLLQWLPTATAGILAILLSVVLGVIDPVPDVVGDAGAAAA